MPPKLEQLKEMITELSEEMTKQLDDAAAIETQEGDVTAEDAEKAQGYMKKHDELLVEKDRLEKREDKWDKQCSLLENRLLEIKKRENQLFSEKAELEKRAILLTERENKLLIELEKVAHLTSQEALSRVN